MQLTSLLVSLLAATSAVSAVKLNCKAKNVQPYCCDNIVKAGLLSVDAGVQCKRAKKGGKTLCPTNTTKVCCTAHPADIANLVELCQLPLNLQKILSHVPGIGSIPGLPGGGLGGILGGLGLGGILE